METKNLMGGVKKWVGAGMPLSSKSVYPQKGKTYLRGQLVNRYPTKPRAKTIGGVMKGIKKAGMKAMTMPARMRYGNKKVDEAMKEIYK